MRQACLLSLLLCLFFPAPAFAQGPPHDRPEDDDPREFFDEIDTSGDGKVTRQELMAMANKFFDGLVAHSSSDDDELSFDEVMVALPRMMSDDDGGEHPFAPPGPPGPPSFSDLDRNRDGVVMPEEFSHPDMQGAAHHWLRARGRSGEGLRPEDVPVFLEEIRRPPSPDSRDHSPGRDGGPEYGARGPGDGGPGGGGPRDEAAMKGRAFDMADLNNDGIIALDEVEPHEREQFKMRLRAYGRSEDDGLSREEFVRGFDADRRSAYGPGANHVEGAYDEKRGGEYEAPGGTPLTLE